MMNNSADQVRPIASQLTILILGLLVGLVLTGCESVPQAQIDEANSLGHGVWRVELSLASDPSASVSRGFGKNTDVGFQADWLDQRTYGVFAKYSHLNQSKGWSLASLAGGFNSENKYLRGYYLGPVASYQSDRFLVSLRARYNKLDIGDNDADDFLFIDYPSDEVAQADASIRVFVADDNLSFKLGYGCRYQLGTLVDTGNLFRTRRRECTPNVGVTLYTR